MQKNLIYADTPLQKEECYFPVLNCGLHIVTSFRRLWDGQGEAIESDKGET
jgi:hypothetical protein